MVGRGTPYATYHMPPSAERSTERSTELTPKSHAEVSRRSLTPKSQIEAYLLYTTCYLQFPRPCTAISLGLVKLEIMSKFVI